MKRLLFAAAALFCAACTPAPALAQTTPVTASALRMGGTVISSGTVTMTTVNSLGQPIAVTTSDGALNGPQGFTATVTNGTIVGNFAVPDQIRSTAIIANTPISYQVQVYNSATRASFTFTIPAGSPVVTGSSPFALDHYAPAQSAAVSPTGILSVTVLPAHCTAPSLIILLQGGAPAPYACVSGVPVVMSGSGASLPTGSGLVKVSAGVAGLAAAGTDFVEPSALAAETARAIAAESANATAISNEVNARGTAISSEASSRSAADTANASAISNEATRAQASESANATAISNEVTARVNADSSEASARSAADTANATAISNEQTRAQAAEAANAISDTLFSALPVPSSSLVGRKYEVIDALPGSACGAGGGTARSLCEVYSPGAGTYAYRPAAQSAGEKNVGNGIVGLGPTVPTLGTPATYDVQGRPFQVGNYAGMFAAGDSYEAALGMPKRQAGFIDTLAADAPAARSGFTDVSVSGLTSTAIGYNLFAGFSPNPQVPSVVVLDGGANDGNFDSTAPTSVASSSLVNYYNVVNFNVSWAALPYSQRMMASAAAKTSGTWTNYTSGNMGVPGQPLNGSQGYEVYTSSSGAVLTFTVTTPANVAALNLKYRQINGYTGSFTVSVDGSPVNERCSGTTAWSKGPCGGAAIYGAVNGQTRVAQTIPVTPASSSGTATTTHTVVITSSDTTLMFITSLDWLLPTPAANTNVVEYLNTNTVWPYSALYNTALSNVIADFRSRGQTEVVLADQNNGVTYAGVTYAGLASTDLGPTTACPTANANHPNCTGHPKLAAILENAANGNGTPYAFTSGGDAAAPERFYSAQITTLASAATLAPASGIVHVTGTTAISTITPMAFCPLVSSGVRCTLTLVPDGAFTTATTGNIALASTAIVGRAMVMTYDLATAKWYPSY